MCRLGFKTPKPCETCIYSPLRLLENKPIPKYDKGLSETVKSKDGTNTAIYVVFTDYSTPPSVY